MAVARQGANTEDHVRQRHVVSVERRRWSSALSEQGKFMEVVIAMGWGQRALIPARALRAKTDASKLSRTPLLQSLRQ
jgi:hypothetical protein